MRRVFAAALCSAMIAASLLAGAATQASAATVGWGSDTPISGTSGDSKIRLANSANGSQVVAVWQETSGPDTLIKAATASVSGTAIAWSPVQALTAAGEDATVPQVVISADGASATAIWQRTSGSDTVIEAKSATIASNVATWGSLATVDGTSGADATEPELVASDSGALVTAIWLSATGGTTLARSASAVVSGTTGAWSSATNVTTADVASNARLDVSSNGQSATAIWGRNQSGTFAYESASATINAGTGNQTWGSATAMSATDNPQFTVPAVAVSDAGTTAVVGYSIVGAGSNIQARSGTVGGATQTWGSPDSLGDITAGIALLARISAAGDRALLTATGTGNSAPRQVTAGAISGATSTWSTDVSLSDATSTANLTLSADGTKFAVGFGTSTFICCENTITVQSGIVPTSGPPTITETSVLSSEFGVHSPSLVASTDGTVSSIAWHGPAGVVTRAGMPPQTPTITNVAISSMSAVVTVAAGGATPTASYLVSASGGQTCTITSPATSCSISASNGTDLSFTAIAINDVGVSGSSAATATYTINPVAGIPTVSADQNGDGSVLVSVGAGTPNTAKQYDVIVTGSPSDSCTVTPPATSCTITGLTPGSYTFDAVASNDAGDSSVAVSAPVTVLAIPGTPSVTATQTGDGEVTATVTPGSPDTATEYTVSVTGSPSDSCTVTPPVTTCTISGLAPGSYTFDAVASNIAGDSAAAVSISVTVVAVPGVPTIAVEQTGDGEVTATITPGSPANATEYTVSVVGSPSDSCTVTPPATTCAISGLAPGSYTFQVIASNIGGDSPPATSTPLTVVAAPGAPEVSAAQSGDGEVTVSVTAGSPDTASEYTVSVTGSPSDSCTVTSPATSCTITGLAPGSYTFDVVASNVAGDSPAAVTNSVTVVEVPGTPGASAVQSGDGEVTVSVTAGSPDTASEYTVSETGSPSDSCTVTPPATSCTITGLAPGSYTFDVVASNEAGDSPTAVSSPLSVVAAPGAPTVTATKSGVDRALITVTPGSPNTAASYLVRVVGDPSKSCTVTPPATSCTITGLPAGSYQFEAIASNVAGSGPTSAPSAQLILPMANQAPARGCVPNGTGPKSIKRNGYTLLMAGQCMSNANQRVGFRVTNAKVRGDANFYRLVCRITSKRMVAPKPSGYAARSVYCPQGSLYIQTYRVRLQLGAQWFAPATSNYKIYDNTRTYLTK